MNLMELLLEMDARLRPLVVADESGLQAAIEEVVAGPRRPGIPPEVEPRVMLAGLLNDIETECRMLCDHLGVRLTTVARVDVSVSGLAGLGPAPAGSNETD
ncbi:MAG TPA: hypothetical protein VFQ25_11510 [Ktedonobacterales bacterium]|nr:hypothetical protein [Ktedonobacterales bacterium]